MNDNTTLAQANPAAATDPWATSAPDAAPAVESAPAADPWGAATDAAPAAAGTDAWSTGTDATAGDDWLGAASDAVSATPDGFSLSQLWDGSLPVESWINQGLAWTVEHFRPFFQTVRGPIDATLQGVEGLLQSVPTLAMVALLGLLAWQFAGRARSGRRGGSAPRSRPGPG